MIEQLQPVLSLFTQQHAVVEAGHYYSDLPLRPVELQGVEVGVRVVDALTTQGLGVTTCVLVDDFHVPEIYTQQNLETIQNLGFHPQEVFMEAEYVDKAFDLLEILKEKNQVKEKKGNILLKADNIPMLVKSNGDPSCSLIDAAVYIAKLNMFGGIQVTVLPELDGQRDYRRQQAYTREILKKAGFSIPILDVFYNSQGQFSVDFDY